MTFLCHPFKFVVMPCKKPLHVQLKQPKLIDGQNMYSVPVACGKCTYCKKQRITGWSFRLEQENKVSNNSFFVTLTYNSEHIPYCKIDKDAKIRSKGELYNKYSQEEILDNITPVPTLNKSDVQKFIKRLRIIEESKYNNKYKEVNGEQVPIKDVFKRKLNNESYDITKKIRYYAAGEYGTKNRRPHVHIILFNIYDTESIDEAWQMGEIDVKPTHENSMSYTLKYLEKDTVHYKYIFALKLQPEFSLSSKGLGKDYIDYDTKKYHINNYDNNVITLNNGVKGKLPRYIHKKLYNQTKKIDRHHVDITEEQQKIDKYLTGLYKHIKKESDKKKEKEEKLLGEKYDRYKLEEAKKSLSINKVKKRD